MNRDEIKRRQIKGIAAAKRAGKYHGKPTKLTRRNRKIRRAFHAYFIRDVYGGTISMAAIARKVGISRQTLYRKIRRYRPQAKDYLNPDEYNSWIIENYPKNSRIYKQARQQRDMKIIRADVYHEYDVEPPWKSQN